MNKFTTLLNNAARNTRTLVARNVLPKLNKAQVMLNKDILSPIVSKDMACRLDIAMNTYAGLTFASSLSHPITRFAAASLYKTKPNSAGKVLVTALLGSGWMISKNPKKALTKQIITFGPLTLLAAIAPLTEEDKAKQPK